MVRTDGSYSKNSAACIWSLREEWHCFHLVGAVCVLGVLALLSACTGQPEASKTSAEEPDAAELKAVIFEDVKPLFSKTDAGYEGFGVDVLEQVRMQSGRSEVTYRVASSVTDGIDAVATGKADIASGVALTWGRAPKLSYSLTFGVVLTRLLSSNNTTINGTPDSLKD